mgnify:CR=1 FL=1
MAEAEEAEECAFCLEPPQNPLTLSCCNHSFCKRCVAEYKNHVHRQNDLCPFCREPLPPGAAQLCDRIATMFARYDRFKRDNNREEMARISTEQLALAQEAVDLDPGHAMAHNFLGLFLKRDSKDLDGAEREFREALRCGTDYACVAAFIAPESTPRLPETAQF